MWHTVVGWVVSDPTDKGTAVPMWHTVSLGEWCLTLQIKALLSLCDTLYRWVSGVWPYVTHCVVGWVVSDPTDKGTAVPMWHTVVGWVVSDPTDKGTAVPMWHTVVGWVVSGPTDKGTSVPMWHTVSLGEWCLTL